jgi:hypothetical protein
MNLDLLVEIRDLLKAVLVEVKGLRGDIQKIQVSPEEQRKMLVDQQRKNFEALASALPPGVKEAFRKISANLVNEGG